MEFVGFVECPDMQKKETLEIRVSFVRLVGLEPTRYHYRQILSLVRLPVPPQPQIKLLDYSIIKCTGLQAVFFKFVFFCFFRENESTNQTFMVSGSG